MSGPRDNGREGHLFVPSMGGHDAPTGLAEVSFAPVGPDTDGRLPAFITPVSQGLPSRVRARVIEVGGKPSRGPAALHSWVQLGKRRSYFGVKSKQNSLR